jgi:hypothetical protein
MFDQEGQVATMCWKLIMNEQERAPMWIKDIGDAHLTVYRACETHAQWKWVVQYGIVTVIGYSKTVRAAKIRATRVARQYVLQGVLWGFQ